MCIKYRTIPEEVVRPSVSARVKQPHYLTAVGIDTSDVRPFVAVAIVASEGEIVFGALSPMLTRDDVVDLKRQVVKMLRHLTVFAGSSGALPNVLLKNAVHGDEVSYLNGIPLVQRNARLGPQQCQQVAHMPVVFKFPFLA